MAEGQEKQVEQLGMSSRRGFIKWALGLSVAIRGRLCSQRGGLSGRKRENSSCR